MKFDSKVVKIDSKVVLSLTKNEIREAHNRKGDEELKWVYSYQIVHDLIKDYLIIKNHFSMFRKQDELVEKIVMP